MCLFAPSRFNQGKVLPIRDKEGAVRLYKHGNLPLPSDVLAYHQEKIAAREGRNHVNLAFKWSLMMFMPSARECWWGSQGDIKTASKGLI